MSDRFALVFDPNYLTVDVYKIDHDYGEGTFDAFLRYPDGTYSRKPSLIGGVRLVRILPDEARAVARRRVALATLARLKREHIRPPIRTKRVRELLMKDPPE